VGVHPCEVVSVYVTFKGYVPFGDVDVNKGTGSGADITVNGSVVLVVVVLLTECRIAQFPTPKVYVTFCEVLNCISVLFPVVFLNVQFQLVIPYPPDTSVNATVNGLTP
jgi:hypothetical protein